MNLSGIDLNLLVVFDAMVMEGSVTRAARRVGLSQPAFSNALGRLRAAVGDPLFVRSGRGLVETPRARALAGPVRRALAELSEALAPRAPFDPSSARRTFTLMTSDLAELMLITSGGLARRLTREAPGIELRVVQGPNGPPRELLAHPGAPDLVIAGLRDVDRGPGCEPLLEQELVCLHRRGHPRVGPRLSLARFLSLDHLLVAPTGAKGSVIDDLLAARGLSRRVALTLAHFFAALVVVSQTDLILSAPSALAGVAERLLPVGSVRHPLKAPSVTIGAFWHPSQEADPAHGWMRALVAEVARESAKTARRRPARRAP